MPAGLGKVQTSTIRRFFIAAQSAFYVTDQSSLNRAEIRAAVTFAAVFFLRLLWLFMLIPVLALYTDRLEAATPTFIGLAGAECLL